ncbi:MAG: Holliday junction resolvase RuvX [Clostridia bacterium]|nr:Holliday junction resolvase RuvX [Clostridia bacterium]
MRILGIDLGDVRTGLALSDESCFLASGLGTFTAYNEDKAMEQILTAIRTHKVEEIVMGNPVNMNGTRGERSQKVEAFAQRLREATGLPVILFDERCTTMQAHTILSFTDTRGKKRKNTVDTLSAEIILQNYLDQRKIKR